MPGRGLEAAADLAPELGADRHVLHVRVRRRQPAGRARPPARTSCGCATRASASCGQHVEVGLGELVELAPALDLRDDLVLVADRLQHARVGREAGLAAALASTARACRTGSPRAAAASRSTNSSPARSQISRSSVAISLVRRGRRPRARRSMFSRTPASSIVAQHRHERQLDLVACSALRPRSASCSRCQAASARRSTASAAGRVVDVGAPGRAPRRARANGKPRRAGSSR